MPQPRKYKTNADRQAAYRQRKANAERAGALAAANRTRHGMDDVTRRVMAADARASS